MTDPRFPVPPGAGGRHHRATEATPAPPADPAPATTVAPAATSSPPEPPSADPAPAPAPAADPDTGTRPKKKIQPQPVLNAAAVQTLLAAAVTVGWVQLDDATVATLATVIAAMVAGLTTWLARGKVTPTKSPRDDTGRTLT